MTQLEEHYRKLERMYLSANINQKLYPTTEVNISDGKAEISITVGDQYFHALNAMHGSVYFKLLDDAAFFAVNSVVTDVFVLTTNFSTNMVRPVTEGKITSKGSLRFTSKNLWIAESTIYNELGKEVGFGTGHFAKSKVQLTEEIGYKL